ncbi:carboxypeptidase [Favolaschia claudopus]|uniref:Carboxypeptidase n=1 Tax=Favolaschia claudopus TaxID=2862362 RepID=A0AAW0A7W0_9AGAR
MYLLRGWTFLAVLCVGLTPAHASQTVFSMTSKGGESPAGSFVPLRTLDAVSETAFTTLKHPLFPNYGVRIKQSNFCEESARAYTGYIDIQARHLFFYFFESRSEPDEDDVIFWTNGGPGCSSEMGLLMELGPCRVVNADNGTVPLKDSWNSKANVFFVDQPIGVGFSYAEYGEHVSTTEEAAQDIAAFVAIFFSHFSKFQGRAFHMSGESYGGRYVPVFAAAVYDNNPRLVEAGVPPINLTSVMIGNGLTDAAAMFPAWYEMQCSPASIPPVQSIQNCVDMKARVPRCAKWIKESCQDRFDLIDCGAATAFCFESMLTPYVALGLNNYDISKKCEVGDMCYPEIPEIAKFLNREDVQSTLGISPGITYTSCSDKVNLDFTWTLDFMKGATEYVAALLERDIRVLIYVGSYDWICNWLGNEAWTLALEWSGHEEFNAQPLEDWVVDGKRAGKTRSAKGFTFATVDGAGHLVPFDKPKESLEMVKRWMAGKPL